MDYTNWLWPQWLMISMMVGAFAIQIGAMLADYKVKADKVATSMVGRIILFTILYFGGFWA